MRGTKILAFACSLIMTWNQIPVYGVPVFAVEENDSKIVTLSNDFVDSLIVKDKIYDGTTDVEVDFSNVVLVGTETGDSLSLMANASFSDANAGDNKTVIISEFELIGENKDDYILDLTSEQETVECIASISPATIHLSPVGTFAEGEKLPKEIEYTYNQNDIFSNDNVNITAKVFISDDGNGNYIYTIDDTTATGNTNYILEMNEGSVPTPSDPSAAVLSSASIVSNGATSLEQYDFGIVANGSVKITVSADLNYDMPVKFTLSDGQEFTDDTPDFNQNENNYLAQADFILELGENEKSKDLTLSLTIENGNQTVTTDLPLKLRDDRGTTSRLIIDANKPTVSSLSLKNHGKEDERYFDATGVFVDNESGIRSIRYRWDNDIKSTNWINYDGFSHNPGDRIDFYIRTDWANSVDPRSKRPDGSHKLELEITDNAGNVYVDDGNLITDGADTKAPHATYIRLDKTTETTWAKIVNILTFGTFINQKLVLSLKVEDRSESEQSSGVKSVILTDGIGDSEREIAELIASNGVYTYTMEPDQIIEAWYVKLTDHNGNTEYFLIRELLNSDIAKEEVLETEPSDDDETEAPTTTTGMD